MSWVRILPASLGSQLAGFPMSPRISPGAIAIFLLTVGAGWLGGALVARRRPQPGARPLTAQPGSVKLCGTR